MEKLISIDLFADFGMLKKPDTNEPVYLTFNMLHKPALLGILGAIIGESGFKEKGVLPDYYLKLNVLKVGIQPLRHEHGNFQKTTITYNNTTGMASKEQGGNLMVSEQTLVAPSFRCYLLLDKKNEIHEKLNDNLSKYHAEYLPYLGKNEFSVWWENYINYEKFTEYKPIDTFKIKSVYIKEIPLKDNKSQVLYDPVLDDKPVGNTFSFFERLPVGYEDIGSKTFQYEYRNFVFTDWSLEFKHESQYQLLIIGKSEIIQVF
jgi:CRISPR-associated protein Cas5h